MAFLVFNGNEEKFAIPNGETVIGRGPYLRVKEPILSRSHAVISLANGHLSIKPTHKNPTYFYATNSKENHVILEKDTWKDLVDGDYISLLSNSYKYRIEITCPESSNENEVKIDTCQTMEGNENENGTSKEPQDTSFSCIQTAKETQDVDEDCMEATLNETLAAPNLVGEEEEESSLAVHACKSSITDGTSSTRKRKLPSWMTEIEPVGKKKKTATPKKIKVAGPKTKKLPLPQVSQIETSPEHKTCYEAKGTPLSEISPVDSHITSGVSIAEAFQDAEKAASPQIENIQDDEQPVAKLANISRTNQDEQSNSAILDDQEDENVKCKEEEDSSEKQGTSDEAKKCPYGKRCYRKNPAHFVEFSHDDNVDSDDEQNNDEDKPECPYGLKCYRQGNPHHTSKFTHTSIGRNRRARQTRKQRNKKKGKSLLDKESDNDGENEYDLNDSFIGSSTDSGGYSDDSDSDYKPYGHHSDDDEDEDVNELLAEAKGFIKNKKM